MISFHSDAFEKASSAYINGGHQLLENMFIKEQNKSGFAKFVKEQFENILQLHGANLKDSAGKFENATNFRTNANIDVNVVCTQSLAEIGAHGSRAQLASIAITKWKAFCASHKIVLSAAALVGAGALGLWSYFNAKPAQSFEA